MDRVRLRIKASHGLFEPLPKRNTKRKQRKVQRNGVRRVFLKLSWHQPEGYEGVERLIYQVHVQGNSKKWKLLHCGDSREAIITGLTGENYTDCEYCFRVSCKIDEEGKGVFDEVSQQFHFAPGLHKALELLDETSNAEIKADSEIQVHSEIQTGLESHAKSELQTRDLERNVREEIKISETDELESSEECDVDGEDIEDDFSAYDITALSPREQLIEIVEKSDRRVMISLRDALHMDQEENEEITWCTNYIKEELVLQVYSAGEEDIEQENRIEGDRQMPIESEESNDLQVEQIADQQEEISRKQREYRETFKKLRQKFSPPIPRCNIVRKPKQPSTPNRNSSNVSSPNTARARSILNKTMKEGQLRKAKQSPEGQEDLRDEETRLRELEEITKFSTKAVQQFYALGDNPGFTKPENLRQLGKSFAMSSRSFSTSYGSLGRKWTKTRSLQGRKISVAGWLVSEFGSIGTAESKTQKGITERNRTDRIPSHISPKTRPQGARFFDFLDPIARSESQSDGSYTMPDSRRKSRTGKKNSLEL